MYGLLLRLSALDADAENAVRLISFFDGLLERGATIDELLRSTAMLAECPVGLRTVDGSIDQEVDPKGVVIHHAMRDGARHRAATVRRLTSGDEVWLTRSDPLPLDEILLERFGIAASFLSGRVSGGLPGLGDPALVELVVSMQAGEVERSRALHLLGMSPMTPLRTLAVRGPRPGSASTGSASPATASTGSASTRSAPTGTASPGAGVSVVGMQRVGAQRVGAQRVGSSATAAAAAAAAVDAAGSTDSGLADIVDQLGGRPAGVRSAPLGHSYVVLTAAPMCPDLSAPPGWHVGIGPRRPAIEAPESWAQAQAALRYTRPQNASREHGIGLDDSVRVAGAIGGFLDLARHLPGEALADIADVLALDAVAAGPGGADVLHTLEVLANTDSVRQAAVALHLHHNSVAHRIARAEETLGYVVTAPGGRIRLALATALRQLRDTRPT